MDATVQADGKISIPKELRDALGLNTGTVMDLQQQAGARVARKKNDPDVFEMARARTTPGRRQHRRIPAVEPRW